MSKNIDKYTNLDLNNIDDFINISNIIAKNPERLIFTKYCRNLINFILNFSKFNFLFGYLSDINKKILNDFDNKKSYILDLISINNVLIIMIKNNNFLLNEFKDIKSTWEPLDQYIRYLQNLDKPNYFLKLPLIGEIKADRLYIETILLEDRLAKFNNNEHKIYKLDIFNYFFNLSKKIVKIKYDIKIRNFINNFSKGENDKIKLMNHAVEYYKNILQYNPNVKEYIIPYEEINKNAKINLNLPILAISGLSLLLAVALKMN